MSCFFNRGSQNFTFLTRHAKHMKFSGLANMKKRYNLAKFEDTKIEGRQTFTFFTTHTRQMKFSK